LKYLIFFLMLCVVSCTPTETSKKEALNTIKSESKNSVAMFTPEAPFVAPKVDIIQINYGPDSLKNIDFLNFIANSKAKLSSVIIENLKTQENKYLNALKKEKNDQAFIAEKIETAAAETKADIKLSKKLNTTMTLNLSGVSLAQVITQVSKKTNIDINEDDVTLILKGHYSGAVSSILKTIAKEHNLFIYKNSTSEGLVIKSKEDKTLTLLDFDSFDTILEAQKDFEIINKKYLEIFPAAVDQSSGTENKTNLAEELKTAKAKTFLETLISDLQTRAIERDKNKEMSDARKLIIQQSKISADDADKLKTVNAIYQSAIKEGEEVIIEKFSVYNQAPTDLVTTMSAYSVFKTGNCSTVTPTTTAITPTTTAITPTTTAVTPTTTAAATTTATTTCLKLTLDKDATGVIASGSINDIKLVQKFIDDQDSPVKQVLIEVWILEMTEGWASSLESKYRKITQTAGTPASTSILSGAIGAVASGGVSITTGLGAKNDIAAAINMLETNSLGRTLSSPSILVKDGATGVVDKTRTVKERVDTVTITNGVSSTATTFNSLDSPLTLTVKPTINKHNDNIDLDFSFKEGKRDQDISSSPETKNTITTKLLIEPGKVIVMAGLKVGTNSIKSDGLPFISKLGLEPMFAPLIGLMGGNQMQSKSSTELLVILSPTVITSKNIDKTMDKALKQ
jgi:type II secretory pathway component GspD/PulD (secretin)